MKKWILCLLAVCCLLSGCAGSTSIVGKWETESAADLGLNVSGGFLDTITRVVFTEDGKGAWEIELVESRQIIRREFTYTLDNNQLEISFPDGSMQKFQVEMKKGNLLLLGAENYSLKPIK